MKRGPLVLVVLDGWGLRPEREGNAIALARTPVYLELLERFPHASLLASGESVGLPPGQMGNSEVGHITIGAGRPVYQDLTQIDKSVETGEFFENPTLLAAMERCANDAHALHLIGLVSDNGIHSHQRHLYALIELAARHRIGRVFVHAFTDGRDTSPTGGVRYIAKLEQVMARAGTGRVASVGGRYFGMDRDNRWDRIRLAYESIANGEGHLVQSPIQYIEQCYRAGVTDEFIEPAAIVDADQKPVGRLADGDSVIFFNFRADRIRQLTRAVAFHYLDGVDHPARLPSVVPTTMTLYNATFHLPVMFPPQSLTGSFAEVIAAKGLTDLRVAETEKYAHVTYFFNCGEERPYTGEDRLMVPSAHVRTYDLKPSMSAAGVTDGLIADLVARRHDVVICNLANADMVGHTGNLNAAVTAVETLDFCLGRIVATIREVGGTLLITADHGNAEQMWDFETNEPHTAHTTNPVPVILVDGNLKSAGLREGGTLRDVAPTMLAILGVEPPKEMTGGDLRIL